MAEAKFEVGQEVIATENLYLITDEVVLKGAKGKVVGHDRQQLAKVRFAGMSWDVSVWGTSITEAPAAPDAGSGADELPTEQDLYEAFFQDKTYGAVKALFDQLQAQLAAAQERIAWAEEILENVEDHAPKDYDKYTKVEPPFEWYMTGVYVKEYREKYPKAAQDTASDSP